jgi:hypothetical protein
MSTVTPSGKIEFNAATVAACEPLQQDVVPADIAATKASKSKGTRVTVQFAGNIESAIANPKNAVMVF